MSTIRTLLRRWTSPPAHHHGTLRVPGPGHDVLIRRDRYGIPHIDAVDDDDAWFACGFCQGQDRPFQIETRVRLVRGTLAGLVGRHGIGLDQLSRRIGFLAAGERQRAALDPELRTLVDTFARGLSQGATLGRRRRGLAFGLLASKPSAVDGADVLAMQGLMSFLIGSNWDGELARLLIASHDGPDALRALEPERATWLPAADQVPAATSDAARRLAADLERFAEHAGGCGGSNAWAVAGARSASGRAIVANDPHLSPDLPAHWYLAHARTPEWAAAGAQLVGTPGFVVGHNEHLAWGVTAGFAANTELFVEELSADGAAVRCGERWEPLVRRRETIRVRAGRAQEVEIAETPRGPLVTEVFGTAPVAVAFDAVWRHPRPTIGFLRAHRAHGLDEFFGSFSAWPGPTLNVVAGDDTGRVGWRLVGDAPLREASYALLPVPGARAASWGDRTVPFEDMPSVIDPPAAFVVTANNRPTGRPDGPYLGDDFLDGYRAARICECVEARSDWTVASTQALQLDRTTLVWRDVRNAFVSAELPDGSGDDPARRALDLLETWDGDEGLASCAATVFEAALCELGRRVAAARAPKAAAWVLGRSPVELLGSSLWSGRRVEHLVALLRDQPDGWFERSWPVEIGDVITTVAADLSRRFGGDPTRWGWGEVRSLILAHPLGRFGPLGALFNLGPVPWGGSGQTVNAGGVGSVDVTEGPSAMPSLRFVTEVGEWTSTRVSLPGGQSGDVESRNYDDLLPFWLTGGGVPIAWTRDEVAVATTATLRLSAESRREGR